MHDLFHGDSLEILKTLPDNFIHSIVTDPPAGISFMGKSWDSNKGGSKQWIEWMTQVMTECYRVVKPNGYVLIWAIPRTQHWTATAVEAAGFDVLGDISHCFGSGFPKAANISKQLEKLPNTEDIAKLYSGYKTALKPAYEPWILARKSDSNAPTDAVVDSQVESHPGFYYTPKCPKADRNEGLPKDALNTHPTLKSYKLMSHLINTVTPQGGNVLDPFMGSGSTGKAAIRDGFRFLGIEMEQEYLDIAKARIEHEEKK